MFIAHGVVLAKKPLKDTQWSLSIYTQEFGKLMLLYPAKTKKYQIDIGSILDMKIRKKNETNILTSIIKHDAYIYTNHCYQTMEMSLWFFHQLHTILPIGVPNITLVMDLQKTIRSISTISSQKKITALLHVFLLRTIVLHGFALGTHSTDFEAFLSRIRTGDIQSSVALLPQTFDMYKSRIYIDKCIQYFLSM